MPNKTMIIFSGFLVLVLVAGGRTKAEDCSTTPGTTCPTITDDVTSHTPKPPAQPKALNMLAEDSMEGVFQPTPLPASQTKRATNATEEPKGRALNFTVAEHTTGNVLHANASHDQFGDLSDVSITDEEGQEDMEKMMDTKDAKANTTLGICEKGGLTYEDGEKLEIGCDSICTCSKGKMDCTDHCTGPYFRRGKKLEDPLCTAKDSDDPCCSVMVCSSDTETEPIEMCSFANHTIHRGQTFNKSCDEVCICEKAGKLLCKPRCPPSNKTSDRCVELPDPNDSCCKKVLCDVTLDDHDEDKPKIKILSAIFVNDTTIKLEFDGKFDDNLPIIDVSEDNSTWSSYQLSPDNYLTIKPPAKFVKLDNSIEPITINTKPITEKTKPSEGCDYKGQTFKEGEEHNDNCESLCVCKKGQMKCLKLECPTYFGVDVLDPNCLDWETVPADFKPKAPHCCADQIRCKNNGSCVHEGRMYRNWEQLPINITGCEKRCYCEMGNVECQNACPPVEALPPPHLGCPAHEAVIKQLDEEDCCKGWQCEHKGHLRNETMTSTDIDSNHSSIPTLFKGPSKVFGPLAVYENDNTPAHNLTLPENPFFHKTKRPGKPTTSVPTSNDFAGPFNPDFINKKQKVKTKSGNKNQAGQPPIVVPPVQEMPFPPPQTQHVAIHGSGTPEDLIHFINQHPEISNYPSGSVLEIHNVGPANNGQKLPTNPQFAIPQHAVTNDLPPGFTLEQFLQELHKTAQNSPIASANPPRAPFGPQYTMQDFLTQPSGPIFSGVNVTKPGFEGNAFNPFQQPSQDELVVQTLQALDSHTIRLAFIIPSVFVGLHGRVEVKYTNEKTDNIDAWKSQIFAPQNDLIATPQLEFELLGLEPDTEYKIKIIIMLRDIRNTPKSKVYKIRTLPAVIATTLPPMIPIGPDLSITDINSTWVTVVWRKFIDYELQFIDGIQLRYKEIDGKIYAATPLIHRAVTSYTLENLKPNTKYEVGIFFIPFPGQLTELHAENMLHFTTANEVDTYGFNVSLDISQIKSTSVTITWSGVPYPEDKYVNIFRAIYQSDSGKEDRNTFKLAKRDSPTKTIIMDLKPGTRYRLWLEVYLTNGKIKTSNVQDFITKPRPAPSLSSSSQQDKLSGTEDSTPKGDYYGPLVIVAILAAIAILSTLVLLLILVRRHNQNKASITPPSTRVSQSAYDNPTYKVEIQQETMGL